MIKNQFSNIHNSEHPLTPSLIKAGELNAHSSLPRFRRRGVAVLGGGVLTFCFLALATTASAASLVKPANNLGLVGYWSFNEATSTTSVGTKAHDFSGNGNTGTLTNMASPATASSGWNPNGKLSGAMNFDGTNDYVDAASSANVNFQLNSTFSISAWVKTTTSNAIVATWLPSSASGWALKINDGSPVGSLQLVFENADGSVGRNYSGTATVNDGRWHHIDVTYDGTNTTGGTKFYIDGVVSTTNLTGNNPVGSLTNSLLTIGALANHASYLFNGSIDEVRIYSRALSAAEVAALYQTGADKISAFNPASISGLKTWLKADAITGIADGANVPTWTDSSGLGNSATQATSGNQPNYIASAISGKPSVRFTRANSDWMATPSITIGTAFVVANYTAGATFADYDGLLTYPGLSILRGNASQNFLIASAGTRYIDSVLTDTVGTLSAKHLYEYKGTPGSGTLFLGRDESGTGFRHWGGDVAEVLVYDTSLSDSDRRKVENYLNNKYQIYSGYTNPVRVNTSQNTTNSSLDSGLVGLWSFNGPDLSGTTATDRSGQGNNGTLTNGPVIATGKVGQALNFDGVNDYVTMGGSDTLNLTSTLTVSAWVNANSLANTAASPYAVVSRMIQVPNYNGYELGLRGVTSQVAYFHTGNTYSGAHTLFGVTVVDDGRWHLITGVYDGTTSFIYVDGVLDASGARTNTLSTSGENFDVGTDYNKDTYFPGKIDEVRIYNRALSAGEVKQLYNMGK